MTLKSYKPRSGSKRRVDDAATAVAAILKLGISDHLKKKLLSRAIWYATECDGKYNLRYASEGAVNLTDKSQRQHEHVSPRKSLVTRMLKEPRKAKAVLRSATACFITRKEHEKLAKVSRDHPLAEGWDRYRLAGIVVWDRGVAPSKRIV